RATGWNTDTTPAGPMPDPVRLWQQEVHRPGIYDLEVDTSLLSPSACADLIRQRISDGPAPSACHRLAVLADRSGDALG
ncbi:MAG: hypothetical protein JOZ51_03760, partial [Chloroflexi bacterium]|nr:hypothetical protein [Chloroflexota bacterium]